jgi:hypothetical protein
MTKTRRLGKVVTVVTTKVVTEKSSYEKSSYEKSSYAVVTPFRKVVTRFRKVVTRFRKVVTIRSLMKYSKKFVYYSLK